MRQTTLPDTPFSQVVGSRQSIRRFQQKEIEPDKLHAMLEAAQCAPSAGDLQAFKMVVVRELKLKQALSAAALNQSFVAQAPLDLVVLALPNQSARKYGERGSYLYCIQDAAIATDHVQLAAAALGLGSVWVGAFHTDEVARIASASDVEIPVAILCVGYAAEEPPLSPRRALNEFVSEVRSVGGPRIPYGKP